LNIALFGGSFDPPHIGHEKIVYEVLNSLKIDKFIIAPAFLNPFKTKSHLDPLDRLNLIKELFQENKNIEVTDFEIKRNKATPTIETIRYIKKIYNPKKIYLIIGADNIKSLYLWQDFDKLKQSVTFISISRDGYEEKNDIIQFINIKIDINISSTTLRENLDLRYIPKKIEQKVKELWKKEFKI
jgi:nicotinate-nucleotide adenylyltransferase